MIRHPDAHWSSRYQDLRETWDHPNFRLSTTEDDAEDRNLPGGSIDTDLERPLHPYVTGIKYFQSASEDLRHDMRLTTQRQTALIRRHEMELRSGASAGTETEELKHPSSSTYAGGSGNYVKLNTLETPTQ